MTYSVLGLDPAAGQLGVAVQSHWLAVGAIVPWAAAGVGVLATQANSDLAAGRRGLELLAASGSAAATIVGLTGDPRAEVSQIAVLDAGGRAAVHTGGRCIAEAGHRAGPGWSVQANMMLRGTVPDAMAAAWARGTGLALAPRLLSVLRAAQDEGGDLRGQQSAAMLIVSRAPAQPPLEKILDVRVDDSTDPLRELARLCQLAEAYAEHEHGLELMTADPAAALAHWARAIALAPGNPELGFWHAIALARAGQRGQARRLLREVSQDSPGWLALLRRLPAAGLLPDDTGLIAELLDAG